MNTLKDKLFILFQHLVPQHALSRLVGFIADCKTPWVKNTFIKYFIHHFNVNMAEAAQPDYEQYENFNAFFTRKLVDGARPIDQGNTVISPADGAISQLGAIEASRLLQAKSKHFSVNALLGGSETWTQTFADGQFATIYLSPRDYHRVHMPISGTLCDMLYIPGQLFSVNNTTANKVDDLFARNERLVCIFDTAIGKVAVILVGAMIVAGIETSWYGQIAPATGKPVNLFTDTHRGIQLEKGEELGLFKLGSTVILLFEQDKVSLHDKLGIYAPVKMGELLATLNE